MNCYFFQNRIVLFQLQTVGCILPVLSCNVPWSSGHTAVFVFGTLQYNLNPVAFSFFCHFPVSLNFFDNTFFLRFLKCGFYTFFFYCMDFGCRNIQFNSTFFFRIIKFLFKQVNVKLPFNPAFRVGNRITHHCSLTCYLTNSWHFYIISWCTNKHVILTACKENTFLINNQEEPKVFPEQLTLILFFAKTEN